MSFLRVSRIALPLVLAATVLSGAALAEGQPTQAEKLLKYRKALYQAIVFNVGPMGHGTGQDAVRRDEIRYSRRPRRGTRADARRVLLPRDRRALRTRS